MMCGYADVRVCRCEDMRMDWSGVRFNNFFTVYVVILLFIKEKEVFMQSTVYSWKPSVSIA